MRQNDLFLRIWNKRVRGLMYTPVDRCLLYLACCAMFFYPSSLHNGPGLFPSLSPAAAYSQIRTHEVNARNTPGARTNPAPRTSRSQVSHQLSA